MRQSVLVVLVLLSTPGMGFGQSTSSFESFIEASAGVAYVVDKPGFDLVGGFKFLASNKLVGSALLDVTLVRGENERYQAETFSDGRETCRDTQTGEFAESSKCSPTEVKVGALAELGYVFALEDGSMMFGAGYRAGDGDTPYGMVGYGPKEMESLPYVWFIQVRGGQDFFGAVIGIGFH